MVKSITFILVYISEVALNTSDITIKYSPFRTAAENLQKEERHLWRLWN